MKNAANPAQTTEKDVEDAIIARVQEFFGDQADEGPLARFAVNENLQDLLLADSSTQAIFLQPFSKAIRQHPHFGAVLTSAQLSA